MRTKTSSPRGTVSAAFFLFCPVMVWPQPMQPPRAQCHTPVKAPRPLPQMSPIQPLCSQSCHPGFYSLIKDRVPLQPGHPQSAKVTLWSGLATPQSHTLLSGPYGSALDIVRALRSGLQPTHGPWSWPRDQNDLPFPVPSVCFRFLHLTAPHPLQMHWNPSRRHSLGKG